MTTSSVQATLAEIAAQCGQGLALPPMGEQQVFAQPWQAQAFATTVALHARGCFTWPEWAQTLSQVLVKAQQRGETLDGHDYYLHWLDALEHLVQAKGLANASQLAALNRAWDQAAHATPHGQPIELSEAVWSRLD
jgi:nitrile hydratase accessory protein